MRNIGFIIGAGLLLIAGCAGIQVSQDFDPATDFGPLKTFAWVSPSQPKTGDTRIDNPLQDTRIRSAVERTLATRGFIPTAHGAASFRVSYQYILRQRMDAGGSGVSFGLGSFGRHGGMAIGTGTGSALGTYDEASLVIDVLAGDSDRLLWRGTGTHRFTEYDDPAAAKAAMDNLVETILAQFPPETS